ncbi:MAG: DegV family protein [Chloroflexota bacterium]|nr:DegV family protein [Chloroflexota bacterium]
MASVKVITDSTSDLPGEMVERLGISVVPLNVHFGDETFLDGVEMTSDEFLQRLSTARQMPRTSQPSPEAFRRSYADAAAAGADGILCITISSKLSGTYNSALLGARDFPLPVRVLDSGSASMGIGFPAQAAAEAASSGASLDEVERIARDVIGRTDILFYVDTLEYLQRNGRIGRAASLVGSILNVKPVLTVAEGEVEQYQRTRTRGKAIQALLDWTRQKPRERLSVMWSENEGDLNRLLEGLSESFPREQIVLVRYGPVLGAHVGPGAMGVIAVDTPGGDGSR